eukprot:4158237-Amphidinium_carterae.1
MASNHGDSCSYILPEDTAQSCSRAGIPTLDNSPSSTEDINRYESENGQGTINDHVKIATV